MKLEFTGNRQKLAKGEEQKVPSLFDLNRD